MERRGEVDDEREDPEGCPRLVLRDRTRDPEDPGDDEPKEDPSGTLTLDRPPRSGDEGQEQVPAELDRDV
jgi:hypothetical protein